MRDELMALASELDAEVQLLEVLSNYWPMLENREELLVTCSKKIRDVLDRMEYLIVHESV